MSGDPGRYSPDSWERTRQEALEARSTGPVSPGWERDSSPATLVPGIVRMSLRGGQADVEHVITMIEQAGAKVWRGDSPGTTSGNQAGHRYFTVEVPPGDSDE